jgi:hypothetical protein
MVNRQRKNEMFLGELPHVEHFWGVFEQKGADWEGMHKGYLGFKVTAADRARFPQLQGVQQVWLYQDREGYVHEVLN